MLGGTERGAGRLTICERTQVLLVEINAVTCCSPAAGMAAGCRPASPWGYQRFAGEYTFLEKRFVAELPPPRPRAAPPQDFTSHHPPPPAPHRPRLRAPLPVETQYGPPPERHPPGPLCAPSAAARPGPPSYETHMRRARAAHLRRGGPPPYISPPAYDAPHRTLQPPLPAQRPRSPLPKPRGRGSVPGGCSHTLPRAATEGGSRWPRGMQPPPGITGPPRHCQTLPRTAAPRHRPIGHGGGRRGTGGHVLIDATRVVVRAQYVPPPQRHQVRYAGGVSVPATPPPGTPSVPHGAPTPPSALSPTRGSKQSPGKGGGSRGRPPPRRPALYSQALREAVSRIRRHTAPDSDSDAEGGSGGGRQRPCRDVSAYSSSSSMESLGGPPPGTASPILA